MPGKINNYGLGDSGVNRVKSPIHLADGELRLAQNAIVSKIQSQHAIAKREGLAKVNSVAAAGAILALVNIPLADPSPGAPPTTILPLEFLDVASQQAVRWNGAAWARSGVNIKWAGFDVTNVPFVDSGYVIMSWEGNGIPDDYSCDGKVYRVVGDLATQIATIAARPGRTLTGIWHCLPGVSNGYQAFRLVYTEADVQYFDFAVLRLSDFSVTLLGGGPVTDYTGAYPMDFWAPLSVAIRHNPITGDDDAYVFTTTFSSYNLEHAATEIRRRIWKAAGLTGAWEAVHDYTHLHQGGQGSIVCDSAGRLYAGYDVAMTTSGATPGNLNRFLTSNDGGLSWDIFTGSDNRIPLYAEPGLVVDRATGAYSTDNGQTWTALDVPAPHGASLNSFGACFVSSFVKIGASYWFWVGQSGDGLYAVYQMPVATMTPVNWGTLLDNDSTLCPLE